MRFCSSCGNKVNETDRFCGSCGAELTAPVSAELSNKNTHPQPAPDLTPEPADTAPTESVDAAPVTKESVPPPSPEPTFSAEPVAAAQKPCKTTPPKSTQKGRRGKGGLSFFGVLVAFGWLFYSSGLLGVFAGAYRFDIDRVISQADWISFGLMIGLPLGINVFRPVLDVIITPLHFIKVRIPPRVLIGAGLLAPFAVSWLLYTVWGFRNYQFLHYSLVIGTMITYAILRTPRRYSV